MVASWSDTAAMCQHPHPLFLLLLCPTVTLWPSEKGWPAWWHMCRPRPYQSCSGGGRWTTTTVRSKVGANRLVPLRQFLNKHQLSFLSEQEDRAELVRLWEKLTFGSWEPSGTWSHHVRCCPTSNTLAVYTANQPGLCQRHDCTSCLTQMIDRQVSLESWQGCINDVTSSRMWRHSCRVPVKPESLWWVLAPWWPTWPPIVQRSSLLPWDECSRRSDLSGLLMAATVHSCDSLMMLLTWSFDLCSGHLEIQRSSSTNTVSEYQTHEMDPSERPAGYTHPCTSIFAGSFIALMHSPNPSIATNHDLNPYRTLTLKSCLSCQTTKRSSPKCLFILILGWGPVWVTQWKISLSFGFTKQNALVFFICKLSNRLVISDSRCICRTC